MMEQQTFMHFVEAINEHDADTIYARLTDDHAFIDAYGNEVNGSDKMKAGWAGYFQWFPDYKIEVTSIFGDNGTIAVFGFASGTLKNRKTDLNENYWRLPAAWKAVVIDNKIKV